MANDSGRSSGSTAGSRRKDARRNRQTLLDAAAAVFVTSGVEAPVRDIATKAGVGAVMDRLIKGGTCVLYDGFKPESFWDTVRRFNITGCCLVGAMTRFYQSFSTGAGAVRPRLLTARGGALRDRALPSAHRTE